MIDVKSWLRGKVGPLLPRRLRLAISFYKHPRIAKTAQLEDRKNITLGTDTFIDQHCILRPAGGKIAIGERTYIGPFSIIMATGGVEIGGEVMVGPHTVFASGNHEIMKNELPMQAYPMVSRGPIIVEHDVWIGAHCLICDNVTVKTGCVIAGGAVVTKSTEAYGIYAGVPAKKIGSRAPSAE
jgi:acetyltransferase-like isoleucine patch superfamily enzyme